MGPSCLQQGTKTRCCVLPMAACLWLESNKKPLHPTNQSRSQSCSSGHNRRQSVPRAEATRPRRRRPPRQPRPPASPRVSARRTRATVSSTHVSSARARLRAWYLRHAHSLSDVRMCALRLSRPPTLVETSGRTAPRCGLLSCACRHASIGVVGALCMQPALCWADRGCWARVGGAHSAKQSVKSRCRPTSARKWRSAGECGCWAGARAGGRTL